METQSRVDLSFAVDLNNVSLDERGILNIENVEVLDEIVGGGNMVCGGCPCGGGCDTAPPSKK